MTQLVLTFVYPSGNKITADPINLCDDCCTAIPKGDVYCDDCMEQNVRAQNEGMDNHFDDSIWY